MVIIEGGANQSLSREKALLGGRVAILYALSRYCAFSSIRRALHGRILAGAASISSAYAATPLILLIAAAIFSGRLKTRYDNRKAGEDPHPWANRYTILSGITGSIWGLGAVVWFVPGSFPAQAYLVLGFLGMSATEFVARAAYRPAYLAHAAGSLVPLAALLVHEGGTLSEFVRHSGAVLRRYALQL